MSDFVNTFNYTIDTIPSFPAREGGFVIRRTFPTHLKEMLDPFLLIDYFGPMEVEKGSKPGVSDHPHRGFQTMTYILQGEVEHKDSRGNHGIIHPGGIQWMVAGKGLIHSEFPSTEFSSQGGILQGVQLWVNLPSSKKLIQPYYQDIAADQLPLIKGDNYTLRILAGSYNAGGHEQSENSEYSAPTPLEWPVFIAHLSLTSGSFSWDINPQFNSGFLVINNSVEATIGTYSSRIEESHLGEIVISTPYESEQSETSIPTSASVTFNSKEQTDILLISGKPINENVIRYGPFVMNDEAGIRQALIDYQSGDFY